MYSITHYYNKRFAPLRTLSELTEGDALALMEKLFSEDTEFGKRFADPLAYLRDRRTTERWVRSEFVKKGRVPKEDYPLYFVLGESRWIERQIPKDFIPGKLSIPLEEFSIDDVSFTYPDSMISKWFCDDKPVEYYNPKYHGIVFTKNEIIEIVDTLGIPEYSWNTGLPDNFAPYIEAQVWNRDAIWRFIS